MHLNPESLSFALLISDLGSIARAANILGMKHATLSRKLTALESRVGVHLFDRSTRGAVIVSAGAAATKGHRTLPDIPGWRSIGLPAIIPTSADPTRSRNPAFPTSRCAGCARRPSRFRTA